MSWQSIDSESKYEESGLADRDWEDAFIKEMSIVSPTYVLSDQSIVNHEALPCLRVFVSSPSIDSFDLEFLFVEIENLSAKFTQDLKPSIHFTFNRVEFSFNASSTPLRCRKAYYRKIQRENWGNQLLYSKLNPFDPDEAFGRLG